MRILDSLGSFDRTVYPKPVVALGNFDGVHLGHKAIFQQAVTRAQAIGGTSVVFTFEPHPLQVLAPEKAPPLLTTFEQKMRLIAEVGIRVALRVPFGKAFAGQAPQDFIRATLCGTLGIHDLIVGYDFRFGHRRAGNTALLQEQASVFGYGVTVVSAITLEGVVVSSSNIRRLLKEGQVETASRLLGRYYTIEGPVVEGFRRGAALGFPTANVQPINALMPHTGVYAVQATVGGERHVGVANIGYNPTFGNRQQSVEVHLFDFSADLYGRTIEVAFVQRIRDERKFDSVDALAAQIACDVQTARAIHSGQTSSS